MLALQRAGVLFCVLLLFMSIGMMFFFTPEVDAHSIAMRRLIGDSTVLPTATDTSTSIVTDTPTALPTPTNTPFPPPTDTPLPTPTDTPIPPPTNTPLPTPTNTPVPPPTNTPVPTDTALPGPTNTPIPQPIMPGVTPTAVINPTSTSVGGVLPPGSTPPGNTTQQITPTPSPTGIKLNGSGLPPTTTDVVPSPTSSPYTAAAFTSQGESTPILSKQTWLIIGALLLLGAIVLSGVLWRQKQVNIARQARLQQQAWGYSPSQILQGTYEDVSAVFGSHIFGSQPEPPSEELTMPATYPAPPAMTRDMQQHADMATIRNDSLMASKTIHIGDSAEMASQAERWYQGEQGNQEMMQLPVTPLPPQEMMYTIDSALETVMRQAQMGLFALPDKEELS